MMIGAQEDVIEPNQEWDVDLFRPEDAAGVVRLFRMVYGEGYPVKTFTDPELLAEENAARRTISSVVRTSAGDIVGHTALFCSAPFKGVFESGASLIAPNYRGGVGFKLFEHSLCEVVPRFGVQVVFGEAVCNHVITQKIGVKMKFEPCALGVDQMPAEAYMQEKSASGRVAVLLAFLIVVSKPQTVYVPGAYEDMVRLIYEGIRHECRFVSSTEDLPTGQETCVDVQIFDFAKVARFAVNEAGADFASVFDSCEKKALDRGTIVHQVWLKLSWPWVGRVVDLLRKRGYFLGGVLPRWFDVDGLLMQKVFGTPNWEGIQVFAQKSGRILEMIKADWELTQNPS